LELKAASFGIFENKKERRRKSVDIKFFGDYLGIESKIKAKFAMEKHSKFPGTF
jgi:hypothetical protein